ncbi:RHS repeat-associated core domain-containing protein [Kutzneria sp. NPDC051319]|uniref:RHS repeat-associated core domain-containing protein n=1 Tax=Kutzneria sp. NPDC051319 TaxID=3155047 RepID=UPI00342D055F
MSDSRRLPRAGWARATVAALVAVIMVVGETQAVAAPKGGWHGLGWDLPELQKPINVTGSPDKPHPLPATKESTLKAPPKVAWPKAEQADVDLPATAAGRAMPHAAAAGKSPVTVTRGHGKDAAGRFSAKADAAPAAHDKGTVRVETVDHSIAQKAKIPGTLVRLSPVSGDTSGPVSVDLDYSAFTDAYGGGYGQRLRWVSYPDCILTTPEKPSCAVPTPIDSVNQEQDHHLVGELTLPAPQRSAKAATAGSGGAVVGATSGPNSGGGDFSATTLSPSGTWTGGSSSGDFSYTYPIGLPAPAGGAAPPLKLTYSSGAVDGLTSATNNQPSVFGDGWELSGAGYIERKFESCATDLGGNNGDKKTGDQCWGTDNATYALGDRSGQLVKDAGNGSWHPKNDDGSRIEHLTGAGNGDDNGEYWKVTTTDGTQYFFGLNHVPGWHDGLADTQSTFTEPVFGNNAGEPCYKDGDFAGSACTQAYRWNLDYVVDPHGNAEVLHYQPETNFYGQNNNWTDPGVQYTRGGYLTEIDYGYNVNVAGAGLFDAAPDRVVFDTTERCLPGGAVTCDPGGLSKDTANSWPDVPADEICNSGDACKNNMNPSFFTRRRVTAISTFSGGTAVNRWDLAQSFPQTGDGSANALWLDGITRTGLTGGSLALPQTTFVGTAMPNRVFPGQNDLTGITRNRITSVVNEQGGVTSVDYTAPDCKGGTPAPEANSSRCYPVFWSYQGNKEPQIDWFNKYLVTDVHEDGRTSLSQQTHTHYDYVGGSAWHYDESPLGDPKYKTWSVWRGFGAVRTTKGDPDDPAGPPSVSVTTFMRGMDGDTLPSGTRSASVTDSIGESIPDSNQFRGMTRETQQLLDGHAISGTITDPWSSGATATGNGMQSFLTGNGATRNRTWIAAANAWRTTRIATTFNGEGLATAVEDDGDVTDPSQANCTRTTYAYNTGAWMLNFPSQVQKVTGACVGSNLARSNNIIADTQTYYDSNGLGGGPSVGNVTKSESLNGWPSGGAEGFVNAGTTFDTYGRVKSSTDELGRTTLTDYSPAAGAPSKITTTSPSLGGTLGSFTSVKNYDAPSGLMTSTVDPNSRVSSASYDPLGRITAVWGPGHDKNHSGPADVKYEYVVSKDKPCLQVTEALQSSGGYAVTYHLVDGLGRTVQAQAPTPFTSGRVVNDTLFDSQGRQWKTHNAFWNGDSGPNGTLITVLDPAVPSTTRIQYDSAGRQTAAISLRDNTELARSTVRNDGDRTTTIPPAGGTAETVINNARGQMARRIQFHDPAHTDPGDAADTTSYTYTPSGQLASVVDSTGKNSWTYTYDARGEKVATTDPDGGTTKAVYDAAGQVLSTTDGRGRTIAFKYDVLGRPTGEFEGSTAGQPLSSYSYDTLLKGLPTRTTRFVNGQPYAATDVSGYDNANRPTGTKVTIVGEAGLAGTYSFPVTYDSNTGKVATTSSPGVGGLPEETIYHGYDAYNNPTTTLAASTGGVTTSLVSETTYDPFGKVLRENFAAATDPNQVSTTNTYDDSTGRQASTLSVRATTSAPQIVNRTFGYDAAGNVTKVADTPAGSGSDVQCFSTDYLRRLTEAWTPGSGKCDDPRSTGGLGGAAPYWTSWTYDQTGNRLTQTQHTGSGDTVAKSTYPAAGAKQPHALQSVETTTPTGTSKIDLTYDNAGNLLTKDKQNFTYDAEGHVATATGLDGKPVSYVYNTDGSRLVTRDSSGTTLTVGDVELFVPAGSSTAQGTRFYSHGGAKVAERSSTRGLTWVVSDAHGTATAQVNAGNLAVSRRYQDPFGNARGPAPSVWNDKHGFLDGFQDTSGLTHVGARDYDQSTGRFTQVDPQFDLTDPQSWNNYAYSGNNPVTWSDPSGKGFWDVLAIVAVVVIVVVVIVAITVTTCGAGDVALAGVAGEGLALGGAEAGADAVGTAAEAAAPEFTTTTELVPETTTTTETTVTTEVNAEAAAEPAATETAASTESETASTASDEATSSEAAPSEAPSSEPAPAEEPVKTGAGNSSEPAGNGGGSGGGGSGGSGGGGGGGSSDPALFRGTTEGYSGSPGTIDSGFTPTSTDPGVATIFATHAAQYGDAVVQGFLPGTLEGVETASGYIAAEAEVAVNLSAEALSQRASFQISVAAARGILSKIGIDIPGRVALSDLTWTLQEVPKLSAGQIEQFIQGALDIG